MSKKTIATIKFVLLIKLLVIIAGFIIEPVWTFIIGINALWMNHFIISKWLPAGMKRFWTILAVCLVGWPIGMMVYPFALDETATIAEWLQPLAGMIPWIILYGIPVDFAVKVAHEQRQYIQVSKECYDLEVMK